jgi:RNA 3'-terminal phosphate cyclase (ATP)
MADDVILDGSYGEGGGQIVRTALALSALTGRPLRITNVRGGRDRPGLRPQHLTAVRAVAATCAAAVEGDTVESREFTFAPQSPVQAGRYDVNVADAAMGGSAGAVTLLLQTLLVPLSLAAGPSTLRLTGGTHVRWSPPYPYITDVYMPLLERMGYRATLELGDWGWYPRGGGQITARIAPVAGGAAALRGLDLAERGRLLGVSGISAASNLPEHVISRQRDHAVARLRARHIKAGIETVDAPSPGPGTILFLRAEYEHLTAGFSGYGRLRYPAEKVAEDAVREFEAHLTARAALDPHLADQVLLPLALVPGASRYSTSEVTRHLLTVIWVVRHFYEREIRVEGEEGAPGTVHIL